MSDKTPHNRIEQEGDKLSSKGPLSEKDKLKYLKQDLNFLSKAFSVAKNLGDLIFTNQDTEKDLPYKNNASYKYFSNTAAHFSITAYEMSNNDDLTLNDIDKKLREVHSKKTLGTALLETAGYYKVLLSAVKIGLADGISKHEDNTFSISQKSDDELVLNKQTLESAVKAIDRALITMGKTFPPYIVKSAVDSNGFKKHIDKSRSSLNRTLQKNYHIDQELSSSPVYTEENNANADSISNLIAKGLKEQRRNPGLLK